MTLRITRMRRKGAQGLWEVTFTEGPPLLLPEETLLRQGLSAGQEIPADRLASIAREAATALCRHAAWRLLSLRPRGEAELRRALRQRHHAPEDVEAVLTDLRGRGFLNDAAFARQLASERRARRDGPRRVEADLRRRGVAPDVARDAVREASPPEAVEADARAVLERWAARQKPRPDGKLQQAAAGFLARKGYDAELVWRLVRDVLGEPREDP